MDDPCIFFIKLPALQQFCHVVFKINNKTSKWPQTQTLKCRQLLFLCRDVMAAPNYFDDTLIDVVMNMEYFKEKKIQIYCQKVGLQPVHASPSMLNVIQECFTYTIRFRISSSYSLISNFLVRGPDVVSCKDKLEAVDIDVVVSEEQLTLTIKPVAIRNPPPSLQNFDICFQALRNFEEDENQTIEEFSIYRSWCHILPTMKKGQLVKVSHKIMIDRNAIEPASFTDYAGLKKYWKNHHGIRLPESDKGMIYGSVYFKLIGHQLFTYPLCCIRTKEIQILPRCDGPAIIKDFMSCLHQKFASICGFKLSYSSRPCYATNNLSEAITIKPGKLQNVSVESANKKMPPAPARPSTSVTDLSQASRKDVIPSSQQNGGNEKEAKKKEESSNYPASQVIPSSQDIVNGCQKQTKIVSEALKQMPTNVNGKFIPVFGKKTQMIKTTSNCAKKIEVDHSKKKKPSFSKKNSSNENTPKTVGKDGSNLGIVTSMAAGKKYKTPSQLSAVLNDSGYDSNETPLQESRQGNIKFPKKYQPKKLSFEKILSSTSDMPSSSWLGKRQNHSFDKHFAKAANEFRVEDDKTQKIQKYAYKKLCPKSADMPEKSINNSPLKVMKKHSFDKLFSKAGNENAKKTISILNATRNHAFDQLFTPAGNTNPPKEDLVNFTSFSNNDSGFQSQTSSLKTIKDHSFDSLFKPARNIEDGVAYGKHVKNYASHLSEVTKGIVSQIKYRDKGDNATSDNQSFDKIFISANSTDGAELPNFSTSKPFIFDNTSLLPSFPKKKHSFDEIFKSARQDISSGSSLLSIPNANDPNGIILSQTAEVVQRRDNSANVQGYLPDDVTSTILKRKLQATRSGTSLVKKPKVNSDICVEDMAKTNKLSRVNAPTLSSWLRSKGVSVKTRDKKEDLIAKVKLQIMLAGGDYKGIDD